VRTSKRYRRLSETLATQLLDFGLTDKEASIYLALLRNGKARAGEIARKLQLNRMIVYRVLTKLQQRELVRATVEKPMKFIPLPLERALGVLIKENESKLGMMRERYDAVIDSWKSLASDPPATDVLSFKVVQGRKQIYDLLLKMFRTADHGIRIVTTRNDLVRFQYVDLDDALKRASRRGVKVQIVLQYEDDKLDILRHYVSFASVKVVPISKAARLFIADDKEMIIAFTMDDSMVLNTKQETCLKILSTEGKSLDTVVDIFANFWESADELGMLDTLPGRSEEDVRSFRTEEAFNRNLEHMVANAESELMIGIAKDTPKAIKDRVLSEISKRTDQVYVRMILHLDYEDLKKRIDLLNKIETYHTDLLQSMQFVIRDQKEILITLYLDGSDGETRVRHLWSNSQLYVNSMMGLLADVWKSGVRVEDRAKELERHETSVRYLSGFRSVLERNHWKVQSPGSITPRPSVSIEFGLLGENPKGSRLAAEFINGSDEHGLEAMTSFYGKAMNAGIDTLVLISVPPLGPRETSFAEYCNMHLVGAEDSDRLTPKLRQLCEENQLTDSPQSGLPPEPTGRLTVNVARTGSCS